MDSITKWYDSEITDVFDGVLKVVVTILWAFFMLLLIVAMPIWFIPYLVYRLKKGEQDG